MPSWMGDAKNSCFSEGCHHYMLHTINESEKPSCMAHINNYLGIFAFLKQCLSMDLLTNDLFDIASDGGLIIVQDAFVEYSEVLDGKIIFSCSKFINMAFPGTIDEQHQESST